MKNKLIVAILMLACLAPFAQAYDMTYRVKIQPEEKIARVTLGIKNFERGKKAISELSFKVKPDLYRNFSANGSFKVGDKRAIWKLPKGDAQIQFDVNLLHERDENEFDSYINQQWTIFRGDDLFPSSKIKGLKGAESNTQLIFDLPESWSYVNAAWYRNEEKGRGHKAEFIVDDPERRFDRPKGWIIAGKIATRRDMLGETLVSISAPLRDESYAKDSGMKRMEALTLLHFVWPEIKKLLPVQPQSLLVVAAGDPMWRGGLSAPYSLYTHEDRPLISENGTSTLLHEVFHSLTRIRGKKNDDWIAEGLAEYYSVMLVYRSGGMAQERMESIFRRMEKRAQTVKKLRVKKSSGATTAKAVLLFRDLDKEIQRHTLNKKNLSDLVKRLVKMRKVGLKDLQQSYTLLTTKQSKVLKAVK